MTEDSGVIAQQSIFGWVLSGAGNRRGKFVEIGSTTALLTLNDIPDHVVKSFWDLQSIGVGEKESVVDPVLERFEQNIRYNMETGRYKVNLAWKENPPVLANTFSLAKSRLLGLEKRLERKLICPRSPWWGGWWVRLVRTVKNRVGFLPAETCFCGTNGRNWHKVLFAGRNIVSAGKYGRNWQKVESLICCHLLHQC